MDDGKVLQLAGGIPGAKLQRWKTVTPNKTMGKQQEAKIKTVLLMGRMKSVEDGQSRPFRFLAAQYLQLPDIQRQASYSWRPVIENRVLQAINLVVYQIGMRQGEILYLTWDRVDLKDNVILLQAADTKTNEGRLVPLTLELTALLKALYKVRYLTEDHVFLVKGHSINSIKTAFNAACCRAGIQGFHFHDFRHTAVTNMRLAGIDHLTIMKITGHKTLDVFKRYNSFLKSDLREAASRFNTYLTSPFCYLGRLI